MLNMSVIYFALPKLKGIEKPDRKIGMKAFWIINFFMLMMILCFTIAGIVQVYLQKIMGIDYLTTQGFLKLWFSLLWVCGWGLTGGIVLYLLDFFFMFRARFIAER